MEANAKKPLFSQTRTSENPTYGFWDWLIRHFYVLPGHPKLDAKHSLVYTFNEQMLYFPIQDEASVPIQTQFFWLCVYCLIWVVIFITRASRNNWHAHALGFIFGFIIIVIESFFYTNVTQAVVMDAPERPYVINTPQVNPPDKGQPMRGGPDVFIDWKVGMGDYKVILGDNVPEPDSRGGSKDSGYIYLADTFINKTQRGDITSMDLEDYLIGVESPDATSSLKHNRFNAGKQRDVTFFSERISRVANAGYYVAVIAITWAIYVTNSKWGNASQLSWNIMTFLIAVASSAFVVDAYNIVSYNNIIYLRKRLLILAISFGITSIFVT